MSKDSTKKAGKFALLLIFFTVFIDLVGFGIVIPLLPIYAEKFGASGLTVGLLLMSYSLMQFFFTPVWGRLSDKVGRRPILLMSLAASAIGYTIWGFAGSLSMLFISRIIAGAGNANIAVAQAYIADVTTAENRAKGMGIVGAAFGLGFVLGPAIGGFCSQYGLAVTGFVAAACSIADLVLTLFLLPEPEKRSQAGHERFVLDPGFYAKAFSNRNLQVSFLIFLISTFAFANMEATLVLLTERQFHFNPAQNAWMFAYIGLIMVFIQGGLIGRLSKRFGEVALVQSGTLLCAIGLLITAFSNSTTLLYVALALLAIGSGINTPSNQSIISQESDPHEVGGVMGIGQSLSTLGRILGPIVGGACFDISMAYPYFVGGAGMLLAFLLSFGLPKLSRSAGPITVAIPPEPSEAKT